MQRFRDRYEAGHKLAEALASYANRDDVVVLGLPRGGVPVAYEVAAALDAPLDVYVVRKLGVPGHEELAMGAIASGGVRVLNRDVVRALEIPEDVIDRVTAEERRELERREQLYRGVRPMPELRGQTVILVDDGIATGSTMRAAIAALRQQNPARLVIAVPVAPFETYQRLQDEVDELVCVMTPQAFHAIGLWYENFSQTPDSEVRDLLEHASMRYDAGTDTDERLDTD